MKIMKKDDIMSLESIAKDIRKKIVLMCFHAGGGHIDPSFSCVELLDVRG